MFNMTEPTQDEVRRIKESLLIHTSISLDLSSSSLVTDLFDLCGRCNSRDIVDHALNLWQMLVLDNPELSKRRLLNQMRRQMLERFQHNDETDASAFQSVTDSNTPIPPAQ